MTRSTLFLRALTALLLCGGLAGCALPSDFEEDVVWAEVHGFDEQVAAKPPPRVVFEPPRLVTLPPELMPARVEEAAATMQTEPPVEPLLPEFAAEPMPEVVPLLINHKLPGAATTAVGAPEFPLLSPAVAAQVPPVTEAVAVSLDKEEDGVKVEEGQPLEPQPEDAKAEVPPSGQAPGLKLKPVATESKLQEVALHLTTGMLPLLDEPKPETSGAPSPGPVATASSAEELPYGIPVPGRPHLLRSPRASELQLVDVTGMAPGDKVKCPFTGDLFRVPSAAQALRTASPADAAAPPN